MSLITFSLFLRCGSSMQYLQISHIICVKMLMWSKKNLIQLDCLPKVSWMVPQTVFIMQDEDISPVEFHRLLQETEKYCKIRADIRNGQIADTSSTQGTNAIWSMTNKGLW